MTSMESLSRAQVIEAAMNKVSAVTNNKDRAWVLRFLQNASESVLRSEQPRPKPPHSTALTSYPPSGRRPAPATSKLDAVKPVAPAKEAAQAPVGPGEGSVRSKQTRCTAAPHNTWHTTQPSGPTRIQPPEPSSQRPNKKLRRSEEALRQGLAAVETEGIADLNLPLHPPRATSAQMTTAAISKGITTEPAWPELDAWAQKQEEEDRKPSRIRYGKRRYVDEGMVNTVLVSGGLMRALTGAEAVGEK